MAELADVPAGTVSGPRAGRQAVSAGDLLRPSFEGATPDGAHVVPASFAGPLTRTTPLATHGGLYEWNAGAPAAGRLTLVSLLPANPAGEQEPAHFPTLAHDTNNCGKRGGGDQAAAVSRDGSRVAFEAEGNLYLRDVTKGETVQLDAPEAGCPAPGQGECEGGTGEFQYMTPDGSRVLFRDTHKLTKGSGANTAGGQADLYECVIGEENGRLVCRLGDLTPMVGGVAALVQGGLVGVSEDGDWVYFAADGALAPGAARSQPENRGMREVV